MNTKPAARIATSLALVACLLGGVVSPVVADQQANRTVAAKEQPLMRKKCIKGFNRENHQKLHYRANVAWKTYEEHRKSEQVLYDQLRWLLANPDDHDDIPVLEQSAAGLLTQIRPTIVKQRDKTYNRLDRFRDKYLGNGCLGKDGTSTLKEGVRYWRRHLKDIYKGHERLFAANMAVQTAQADLAGQAMQDAELEVATAQENLERAFDLLDSLVK